MVRVAGLLFVLSHVLPHNSAITKSPTTPVGKVSRAGAAAPRRSYQSDVRLGQIVRLLMDHATVVVSGTKISQQIGTTRSQVWRLIQQLRRLGVDIAGHPATGYQLRALPDLLLPDILAFLDQVWKRSKSVARG